MSERRTRSTSSFISRSRSLVRLRIRSSSERMRRRTKDLEREMNAEVERVRRSLKAELVPYGAYDATDLVPADQAQPIKIPVKRTRKKS